MHVIDVMAMSDGHCYRIEAVMHVINVMAMVMEVIDNCYRIEAVMLCDKTL